MKVPSVTILLLTLASLQVHGCNQDDKDVGVCLHIYLERDFSAIEAVVYPELQAKRQQQSGPDGRRTLLLDGPELENNCERLRDMLVCFSEVLPNCYYNEDFFRFRHLVHSLNLTHKWTCSQLRERFLVILRSVACVEKQRTDFCSHQNIQPNIWQQILRLEVGPEACSALNYQRECLLQHGTLDRCGEGTEKVYSELSYTFLDTWCNGDPSLAMPGGAWSITPRGSLCALLALLLWSFSL